METALIKIDKYEGTITVNIANQEIAGWQWLEPLCDKINYEGLSGTMLNSPMRVPRECVVFVLKDRLMRVLFKRRPVNVKILDEENNILDKFGFIPPVIYDHGHNGICRHLRKVEALNGALESLKKDKAISAEHLAHVIENNVVDELWWLLENMQRTR